MDVRRGFAVVKRYIGTMHAYQDYRGRTFHGPMKAEKAGYITTSCRLVYRVNIYVK